LYVSIKIKSLFLCHVLETKILHAQVSTFTSVLVFSRLQEVGLFVSYDIVLCYGWERQPIGRESEVQERRLRKNMKTNSRFYEIRIRKFRVGAVQDN